MVGRRAFIGGVALALGAPGTVLATGRPNTGSCVVTLPDAAIPDARIRLQSEQTSVAAPGLYADSAIFTLAV